MKIASNAIRMKLRSNAAVRCPSSAKAEGRVGLNSPPADELHPQR
jgi:hypothetical protein